jgi:hypothetical protein
VPSPTRRQYLIYTLVYISQGTHWDAAMGTRTSSGLRKQDSISVQRSFDTRADANNWLLGLATELNVPSLPKTVRATRVPMRLGGPIPERTP